MTKYEKLLDRIQQKVELCGSAIYHVVVEHDDGCPSLSTNDLADCECEPDISVLPEKEEGLMQLQKKNDKYFLGSVELPGMQDGDVLGIPLDTQLDSLQVTKILQTYIAIQSAEANR